MVPLETKRLTTFNVFKREVKKWKPKNCPLRLFKKYIKSLSFVNAYEANVPVFDLLINCYFFIYAIISF